MKSLNTILTKTIPARLRSASHIATSIQGSLAKEWWKSRVQDWSIVRHACVEDYGEFPIREPWARSEASFGTKYAYVLRGAEVTLGLGRVRLGKWWLAESFGNFIHAPFGSLIISPAIWIAKLCRRYVSVTDSDQDCVVHVCSGPYFHFIMEELVPLLYALDFRPNSIVVVLKKDYEKVKYFKEYIDLLVDSGRIKDLRLTDADFLYAHRYVFVTHEIDSGLFCKASIDLIRDAYIDEQESVRAWRKIFLTRKRRRFDNQDEIESYATGLGFEIVDTEGMPLRDQIKLFCDAKCVISNHGAGLTNLVFANDGISVVELFPAGLLNDAYYRMSKIKKIRYQCLISNRNDNIDGYGSIDMPQFIKIVDNL